MRRRGSEDDGAKGEEKRAMKVWAGRASSCARAPVHGRGNFPGCSTGVFLARRRSFVIARAGAVGRAGRV